MIRSDLEFPDYSASTMREKLDLELLKSSVQMNTIFVYKLFKGNICSSDLLELFPLRLPPKQVRSKALFAILYDKTNNNSSIARIMSNVNTAPDMKIDKCIWYEYE